MCEEVKVEGIESDAQVAENVYEDITLICKDCGQEFVFTAGEQAFYNEKGYVHQPKACRECRNKRKNAEKPEREMYTAICSECGAEAKVPFQPRSDRPVYCSKCYEERRSH